MPHLPGFRELPNDELLETLAERVGQRVHVSVGVLGGGGSGVPTIGIVGMLRASESPAVFYLDGGQGHGFLPTLDLQGATGLVGETAPGVGIPLGESGIVHIATDDELAGLDDTP